MTCSFRKYLLPLLLSGVCSMAYLPKAEAGAWTKQKGKGEIITTGSQYITNSFYDKNRNRHGQSGSYHKRELGIFAEYGLTDDYTIGFQPTYQWIQTRGSGGTNRDDDLGDTSLFLRKRLWHDDYNLFSLQGLVTIPGPYDRNTPAALGYGQSDLELRGLFGHSGKWKDKDYFLDVQAAYRKRFDDPADEMRFDLTAGIKPKAGWMLLAQSFNTVGLRNESGNSFLTANGPDYDIYKLRLSVVKNITDNLSLQIGGETEYYGRNTSTGNTLVVSIWRSF